MKKHIIVLSLGLSLAASAFATEPSGKLYLSGPFNYYGFMGSFSEKWELKKVSEDANIYSGSFNIPADKLIFNITDFTDEDTYHIYGSKVREGNRVNFDFIEEEGEFTAELTYEGSGDWSYPEWPGGLIIFEIDMDAENPVVTLSTNINPETGEAGIKMIFNGESDKPIYDLKGNRVNLSDAKNGIYILNGKKVIVK